MFPPYISWELNSECNHDCFYCYNYWRTDKTCMKEEHADYEKICKFILSQKPSHVTLTGGEPLLVFEQVKECIKKFRSAGIYVRIVTNGARITEEIAKFCEVYGVQLMVSFPSVEKSIFEETTNRKGSYHATIRGMDFLKHCQVMFSQNIVVTEKNLKTLDETVAFLKERYQIRRLFISRATKPMNARDDLDKYLLDKDRLRVLVKKCVELQKKYRVVIRACGGYPFCALETEEEFAMFAKGCGGGENGYVIAGNGDVRVCVRDSMSYGNVFETPIEAIQKRMAVWTTDYGLPEECKRCNMREICRGGCHMASCSKKHEYNSLDYAARPERQPIGFRPSGETCMTRYIKKI